MRRYAVALTTAADGTLTTYTPKFSGKIHALEYVKNNFDNGVDFTVTGEATGINIWTQADVNASVVVHPRAPTHSQAGAAALYAAGGTGVLEKIGLANDRVKIVIAQGGNAKQGTLHVVVDND